MITKDRLDDQLIALIGNNTRQSSKMLAEKLKVSPATVRRRLAKLLHSGVLHYVAAIDPTKTEAFLPVVIALDVRQNRVNSVTEMLIKVPEIQWIVTTTGRFDILATAYLSSIGRLSEFLEREFGQVEGINDIETFVCMNVLKGRLMPIGND